MALRAATVAIEDERFYKHKGVDYDAIVRAGVRNIESGKTVQGGSTITQQLVRALYIKDPERNFTRKIREAKLASELEEEHSKTWILHNYLNDVPYGTVGGRTAIGVEAAAETFFAKHAQDLDLTRRRCSPACPRRPRSTTRSATPRPRSPAATRCSSRWPRTASSRTAEAEEATRRPARPQARHPLQPAPRALLLRLRAGAADRGLRRGRLPPRRAEDPHHDRPRRSRTPRARRSRASCPTPTTPRRRSSRSTRPTATSARWPRAAPTRTARSTSPPRATASRARPSRRWC